MGVLVLGQGREVGVWGWVELGVGYLGVTGVRRVSMDSLCRLESYGGLYLFISTVLLW